MDFVPESGVKNYNGIKNVKRKLFKIFFFKFFVTVLMLSYTFAGAT